MSELNLDALDQDTLDVDAIFREHQSRNPIQNATQELLDAWVDFNRKEDFQPGDLITWKPRFRDRPYPVYGRPALFVRWLEQPVEESVKGYGGDYAIAFRCFDMEVAALDDEGDWLLFISDSRRVTIWRQDHFGETR